MHLSPDGAERLNIMKKDKLTPLEESLCQAYLVSKDKSDALRNSKYKTDGWKMETINRQAKKLFDKPKISARVAELLEARSERVNYKADDLLKDLLAVKEMDVVDILTDKGGIKPIGEWPKVWRQMIGGIDVTEIGDKENAVGLLSKIKIPDKVKNLELIGRHVDVQAWKDRIETEDVTDYAKLLESRARAAERLRNGAD